MKIVNFGFICIIMVYSVFMAVVCNLGIEFKVFIRGWMIREVNFVRLRVKVNLFIVFKVILKKEIRDYNVFCEC